MPEDNSAIGTISGKVTTTYFDVLLSKTADKFEFIRAKHATLGVALSQIEEIEIGDQNIAHCKVIGVLDEEGRVNALKNPLLPETAVFIAENELIQKFFHLEKTKEGAYIGMMSKRSIPIYLDLNKLLTKHVAVLAKSGAGKSYSVGVLLEEIMEQNVPLVVIDPHGEYNTLNQKNTFPKDIARMPSFGIAPKAYKGTREYASPAINKDAKPILLPARMSKEDMVHIMPRLSSNQLGVLYNALKLVKDMTFESLRRQLELDESPSKWTLLPLIDYITQMGLFSENPIAYHEIVGRGCSIVNLKGYNPDIQELIVWKICSDLFQLRKEGKIPPFFLVVEEAHNFCPERSFGETKCSKILRDIASEGRKFGLGLCVISQRPARVDKSVLSQCTTQVILKVTNPNDLKAITSSVEGISASSEAEIQSLPIGSALITGVVDIPLFVSIRPRKTLHGGAAINILASSQEGKTFFEKFDEFDSKNHLPLIGLPKLMDGEQDTENSRKREFLLRDGRLIPCYYFVCKDKEGQYGLLAELETGTVVANFSPLELKRLPELEGLLKKELHILQNAYALQAFSDEDLIKRLGMNLTVKEELNTLVRKGYLVKAKDGKKYTISGNYIWKGLSHYACSAEIELVETPALSKGAEGVKLDELRERLNKFTDVLDQRQCFLIAEKEKK